MPIGSDIVINQPIGISGGGASWYKSGASIATSLIGLWKLNEASGDAGDSVGSSTLTNTGVAVATAGKVYSNAFQFTRATPKYFTINDSATLSASDIDFWLGAWFYLDTKPAAGQSTVVGKGFAAANQQEFVIEYDTTGDVLVWGTSDDGISMSTLTVSGSLSLSAWHFAVVYHNAAANVKGWSVDGAAISTTAWSTGVFNGTSTFRIGADSAAASAFDGRIGPVYYGKNYVPTNADVAYLYNGGLGRP